MYYRELLATDKHEKLIIKSYKEMTIRNKLSWIPEAKIVYWLLSVIIFGHFNSCGIPSCLIFHHNKTASNCYSLFASSSSSSRSTLPFAYCEIFIASKIVKSITFRVTKINFFTTKSALNKPCKTETARHDNIFAIHYRCNNLKVNSRMQSLKIYFDNDQITKQNENQWPLEREWKPFIKCD